MHSNEERMAAVKQRAAQLKREQQKRQSVLAAAGSLALIIGLSLGMPSLLERTSHYTGYAATASIFQSGAALGFWVIGLVAFVLGVCVTLLCVRLQRLSKEKTDD